MDMSRQSSSTQASHRPTLNGKRGVQLIEDPLLNRGTAFTESQRRDFGLRGLLPPHVETLEAQSERAYEAYKETTVRLG